MKPKRPAAYPTTPMNTTICALTSRVHVLARGLRRWFRYRRASGRQCIHRFRPHLEWLEDRCVPALVAAPVATETVIFTFGGTVNVAGTQVNDGEQPEG